MQYADYALWQRELLGEAEGDAGQLLSEQLSFWKEALVGIAGGAGAAGGSTAAGGGELSRLERAGRRGSGAARRAAGAGPRSEGASLFMVVQAGLAALLSRLGAGEDIAIGSPVAGRGEQALEDLVGFFVNTLVLRTDVSGTRVSASWWGGCGRLTWRRTIIRTCRSSGWWRRCSRRDRWPGTRCFRSGSCCKTRRRPNLVLTGLQARPEPLALNVAKFDMTVGVGERRGPRGEPAGIDGWLEFSHDLFDEGTAEALATRLVRLLGAAVASPDLPLLPVGDRRCGRAPYIARSVQRHGACCPGGVPARSCSRPRRHARPMRWHWSTMTSI